jgi:hypothetical protein
VTSMCSRSSMEAGRVVHMYVPCFSHVTVVVAGYNRITTYLYLLEKSPSIARP